MDFESPDVEKDFPGLYASETGRKSNESDFSDGGDHEKPGKKDLLGRRKDKKESKKDRGYAALEGESSPEEDTDTKSPSKSKKTKSFKFPTKSKEKREKSRDKEKVLEDAAKQREFSEKEKKKEKEREKEKEKERKEKEKRDKLKEKEKLKEKDKEKEEKSKFKLESKEKLKDDKKEKVKEKDKEKVKEKEKEKVKEKDKDKKDKKLTKVPSTVTSGVPFEEIFTLGVALPIFGVPLQQSVERSRCHDDSKLPLVVRDSIDYLQAHGLKSPQIYRAEADKIKLAQLRKLYTDRGPTFPYHWDVPVACAMLKTFISELPDSILTQELHGQFEGAAAIAEPVRSGAVGALLARLPACQRALLACLARHFESVVANQQFEGAAAIAEPVRSGAVGALLARLPACQRALLACLARHFESVVANQQVNHVTIQTIATAMGPALNMSFNLLQYFITKAEKLFPDVQLTKYVPPLQSLPADFSDAAADISLELRKQESLLNQIHAEMHAGFITAARDQALWEAQRIVTQLKRKLRSVQKSAEPNSLPPQPSLDEKPDDEPIRRDSQPVELAPPDPEPKTPQQPTTSTADAFQTESPKTQDENAPIFEAEFEDNFDFKPAEVADKFEFKPSEIQDSFEFKPTDIDDKFEFKPADIKDSFEFPTEIKDSFEFPTEVKDNFEFPTEVKDNFEFPTEVKEVIKEEPLPTEPAKEKPKFTEKELRVLRLELENAEYLQLKSLLQAKINSEQFEIVKLRSHVALKNKQEAALNSKENKENHTPDEQELKHRLMKENALLEQKRLNLINQIFQERVACIQLKIELAMKEILSK